MWSPKGQFIYKEQRNAVGGSLIFKGQLLATYMWDGAARDTLDTVQCSCRTGIRTRIKKLLLAAKSNLVAIAPQKP